MGKGKDKFLFGLLLVVLSTAISVFIASQMHKAKAVDTDIQAFKDQIITAGLNENMIDGTDMKLKNHFHLVSVDYQDVMYLSPENFMDVGEVLVVKLKDPSQKEDVKKACFDRLDRMNATFENYGTDQFSILKDTVIYDNDLYVIYVAGKDATTISGMIMKEIER